MVACSAALPASAAAASRCPTYATIVGTAGDDQLAGTAGDDIICGADGNDVIVGNGGNDDLYGGDGNDQITSSQVSNDDHANVNGGPGDDRITGGAEADWVFAGSGSDTIISGAGNDFIQADNPTGGVRDKTDEGPDGNDMVYAGTGGDSVEGGAGNDLIFTGGIGGTDAARDMDSAYGDAGNDIILSDFRYPGMMDMFKGGDGSDLLWPNPIRTSPLGNLAIGGQGNDVIVLLNGLPDSATMGETATALQVPLGNLCSVTVPLPTDPKPGDSGKLSCRLPINVKIPGLVDGLSLKADVDSTGKITHDVNVKPSALLTNLGALTKLAADGFPADMCVCDPQLPGVGWAALSGDRVS
jgi:hemolysin type calcium-binding protein